MALVERHGREENWLAVLVTTRVDGTPSVSVVNAGLLPHPVSGRRIVGLVARGGTAKLRNLRANHRAALVFRSGWKRAAVYGQVELAGPDDPLAGLPQESVSDLLRTIYVAAGGTHPDLDTYDRVMIAERRAAVLVQPEHCTTNPPGTEHQESP